MSVVPTVPACFSLDTELPAHEYVEQRPTITMLVRTDGGDLLLVRPHKVNHRANEWQLPQGPIPRRMPPRQAMFVVARAECSLLPHMLQADHVKALGVGRTQSRDGEIKAHYLVAVAVTHEGLSVLRRHTNVFLAGGPNCVWGKVKDCRPPKREFIARCLRLAMVQKFLVSDRWALDRLAPFTQFAGL